jgi:hypothetical protein
MARLPVLFSGAALICNSYSFCQPDDYSTITSKVYNYKLVIEAPLYPCDIVGNVNDSAALQVAEPGSIFTVVSAKNLDTVIIRFWKWKENKVLNFALCYADSLCSTRKYFLLSALDLKNKTMVRYDTKACFTAGTALVPVKLRMQQFDFSKDLTLGPVAGVKFRLSHYASNYVSVLAGMGITSVTLDERSTDGRVEESMEVPALTPSLGVVFEFPNATQVGIFCGWDHIADNENLNLVYYGKLWMSFGLGFSIISKGDNVSEYDESAQ